MSESSSRQQILDSIKTQPEVSVLIVGAGINGIGTFRDLALNGVDVLLVDRGDFCSGASAASSHMAHGGIRYLENGEFRLVREAVRERNRLIENAEHLVRPLPTTIPIFRRYSGLLNAPLKFLGLLDRPAERGELVIRLGLWLYDRFTRGQGTVPTHRLEAREAALQKFPRLNPSILSAATYYDGSIFSPERLALELVLDGEAEGPHARALNYVSLAGMDSGQVALRDETSGETFLVRPKVLINAAGPWIDLANRTLGTQTEYIGGTKGSHIVLDHPQLRRTIGKHEFFFENQDGRIVLIFPLGDKVLVGTSDIPVDSPDEARCTEEEVDYFLKLIGRVFPDISVDRSQVVFRFAGVRPLANRHGRTAGQITRDHRIESDTIEGLQVFSLVGGKWTTYRAFSEQAASRVMASLGIERTKSTRDLQIGGGKDYPRNGFATISWVRALYEQTGLPAGQPKLLYDRYGTRAAEFAGFIARGQDAWLANRPDFSRREVEYLALREKIVHLDDLLLRRTMLAMLGELSRPLVDELAGILASALGWDEERTTREIERALAILQERHSVLL